MRLALFTDGLSPFQMGGMQRHSRLLAEYLALEGVSISIYSVAQSGKSPEDVLRSFSPMAQPHIRVELFPFPPSHGLPGHYLRANKLFAQTLTEAFWPLRGEFDFVLTKGFTGWELGKRRDRPPMGVKFHGMNMFQPQPNLAGEFSKFLFRAPVRRIMHQSELVFSYGGGITDIITRQGIQREKIVEVPAGISQQWIASAPSGVKQMRTRFLFIGRFDRLKGLPELYKAVALLPVGECEFWFVGNIPDEAQLRRSDCRYFGTVTDEVELQGMYDQCDYLLLPSISEGMPNVVLEAMARGVPVIATNVGAVSLLVTEQTGFMLPNLKPASIAAAVQHAHGLPSDNYTSLSAEAHSHVAGRFTWPTIVRQWLREVNQRIKSR